MTVTTLQPSQAELDAAKVLEHLQKRNRITRRDITLLCHVGSDDAITKIMKLVAKMDIYVIRERHALVYIPN